MRAKNRRKRRHILQIGHTARPMLALFDSGFAGDYHRLTVMPMTPNAKRAGTPAWVTTALLIVLVAAALLIFGRYGYES